MKKVKGILRGQVIKLLEKIEVKDGSKAEVIFEEGEVEAIQRLIRHLESDVRQLQRV